jgi:septal ring factor EnvC (AmiA/AmiB activator)
VWTITAAPKPSPNDPQAVLDSLRREIDRIDRELEARQSREQDVLRDAAAARQRAALIEQMIHNQSTQVDGLRDSIAALESEIAPRNAELADLGTRLIGLEDEQQRIAASLAKSFLVERRLTGWASLEFLLGSRSWRELLARRELLKRLQTVERHSLTALNSVKDSLQLTEGAIFESARNLRERQSDLEQSRGLAAAKEETYRADLQKLDAEKSELQDRLSDLRRERKSLSARRKEVSKAQREIGHMIDRATERAPLAGTSLDLRKGSLPWPVDGQVVERFGLVHNRKLDTVTENPGIELSTAADASVTSVADGRVSSVTWLRGYGTVCIVEHPGSIYTVYAKLDKVVVKANESIKSGALLGQPAYDAGARDYRVHFEVWSGKEKKDPIEWLQAR